MDLRQKLLKKPFRLTVLTLLVVSLCSQGISSKQDVSEYQKLLDKISDQIGQIRAKIEGEEKKETTILSRLDMIGFNKKLIKKEISLHTIQQRKANRELSSIKKQIPPLKAKLSKGKKSVERILVTTYKFGKFSFLQFMLQAKDVGTLISENKNLTLLAQYQEKIITDYLEALNQLKQTEENVEGKRREISRLIRIARKKRQDLTAQETKNRALIRETKENRKVHLQTIEELKERAEQLQVLIKGLLEEKISFPFPLVPLWEKKGNLSWPIEGKVITSFGLQKHPKFKTVTVNNGIDISPDKNETVIKAIHAGKVVYCDYLRGYGDLIIIDHGMTYHSLYGHCADFLVKKGDIVKAGQSIAEVGDIGSLKGITLHFEIREKTKPRNPLHWLERR
ncbi:MAG: peptidoglycan DD-metalloendopeptidase family protein [Candidatus Aminicenantes bacterium]|nr:peptidoglycan DD-metalloendopeptidase family protein [Candidatus Aminicenantes bacterium]